MSKSDQEYFDSMLPEWASGFAEGKLVLGAQLPTRDGRRMGNAHIIQVGVSSRWPQAGELYLILTDAGNTIVMTASEVQGAFWPPVFVSEVKRIIDRFWHDPGDPPVIM